MKLLLLTLLLSIFATNVTLSQTTSKTKAKSKTKSSKKSKKDKTIDEPFFTGREKVKNGIRVYRLHLLTSSDRNLVYQTKSKVYQKYPNQKQIVMNAFPMYKLWFGSFLTKTEAVKYQKALSPMFTEGIYIITDEAELVVRKVYKPKPVKPVAPVKVTTSAKPVKSKKKV